MNPVDIREGQSLTYYPPPANKEDNRHPRATVIAVKARKAQVLVEGETRPRWVSANRLSDQAELLP